MSDDGTDPDSPHLLQNAPDPSAQHQLAPAPVSFPPQERPESAFDVPSDQHLLSPERPSLALSWIDFPAISDTLLAPFGSNRMAEEYFPVSNPSSPRRASGRHPSWAGASSRGSDRDPASPAGSPNLGASRSREHSSGGLSPPAAATMTGGSGGGHRSSRYSALPLSEDERTEPPSGRTTPGWSGRGEFSSAASYANFNGKSRPHSMNSSHMLGKDYDSIAGLNVPLDKYEDGSWDRTPGSETATHPRHKHLAKYGVAADASRKRKCILITIIAIIVLIVIIAVVVPVAVVVGGKKSSDAGSGSNKSGTTETDGTGHGIDGKVLTSGHDGSVVELKNGTSFTYVNKLGGFWVSDHLNDSAQAQSYTKPLSEEWDWANDRMYGVNLGGWLVTEPFIAPNLYEPYENTDTPAVDEFTLSQRYLAEGGQANLEAKMRAHYDTFITEKDFADIAGAGLNWIRLPMGFWALETQENEPFLAKVSWEYVLKAIEWARKYGLRINLDLHAVPGGQNTYNHSGRLRYMSWLTGVMGLVNAQRTLNYIRAITEFISQPEIRKVVPLFSVVNEPNLPSGIGLDQLKSFYVETYTMMRNITGTGAGNGPMIGFHDGFLGLDNFNGFLVNSDRVAYDTHPYIAFTPPYGASYDAGIANVCNSYTSNTDKAMSNLGVYMAGEWSLALNDCGQYLNNVGQGTRYEGTYPGSTTRYGDCNDWTNWQGYSQATKDSMKRFAVAQMSSLRNFFFWTWHIGYSTRTNNTINPAWNYKLGLEQGWMPTNIHEVVNNACQTEASRITTSSITNTATSYSGTMQPWQTGKADSYNVNVASNNQWPPATISSGGTNGPSSMTLPASTLPTLVRNAPILTVPTPSFTESYKGQPTASIGAWFNQADNAPMYGYPQGCPAVDPYYNGSSLPPGYPCGGNNGRRAEAAAAPAPTTAPRPVYTRDA